MLKDIIQWNYERGSWQYDIFCLMIIAFIFLTPKAWFDKREIGATRAPQTVVKIEDSRASSNDRSFDGREIAHKKDSYATEKR